jgi:hypothetical protein
MSDPREAIMVRLQAIAISVLGNSERAHRNRLDFPDADRDPRPRIVILEGDEEVNDDVPGRGRPASGPRIVTAKPHVFLLAGAKSETVGTALNLLRAQYLKAVLTDGALAGIAHKGEVNYAGMATGLAAGRTMQGEANLVLSIPYVMWPTELV